MQSHFRHFNKQKIEVQHILLTILWKKTIINLNDHTSSCRWLTFLCVSKRYINDGKACFSKIWNSHISYNRKTYCHLPKSSKFITFFKSKSQTSTLPFAAALNGIKFIFDEAENVPQSFWSKHTCECNGDLSYPQCLDLLRFPKEFL